MAFIEHILPYTKLGDFWCIKIKIKSNNIMVVTRWGISVYVLP